MNESTVSNSLASIQIIFIIIQTVLIVWVSKEWVNQKRTERYADQCHNILKHWWKIEQYLYILAGSPEEGDGEYDVEYYAEDDDKHARDYAKNYAQRFLENNKDSIMIFLSFLRNPEIYIGKKRR